MESRMFDDTALFVHIVKAGSLKEAARVLGLPQATVSRRLKQLEQALSCRLIHRSSHQFTLTHEGEELYGQSAYFVESLEARLAVFQDEVSGSRGKIRVLAPLSLTISTLQSMFTRFLEANPGIELQLELSNELTRFLASGADFALRVGPQEDSELSQVKLGDIPLRVVATPGYLAGLSSPPGTPEDLRACRSIVVTPIARWRLQHRTTGERVEFVPDGARVATNELRVARNFVLDGLGVALLPLTEIRDELESGELVPVLADWQGVSRELFAVWYRRQLLTHRASRLIDHVREECRDLPCLTAAGAPKRETASRH
ncbi:LysR family transcriptional regulator [Halomonas nitroreducens]|uniref:LysR family transcriptional regulator n=2 Tax=Halomonas nitroreducens TaxID=447425 RepID=A0A3S0KSP6_9GAMM|nr:LysR family transcriptional regulator [Halomonas nitroreducens]